MHPMPGFNAGNRVHRKGGCNQKILKHLGLWDIKRKPSPVANAPPIIPDSYPIPRCRGEALSEDRSVDDYVIDPVYPVEIYL
jgi:hypothetical protein